MSLRPNYTVQQRIGWAPTPEPDECRIASEDGDDDSLDARVWAQACQRSFSSAVLPSTAQCAPGSHAGQLGDHAIAWHIVHTTTAPMGIATTPPFTARLLTYVVDDSTLQTISPTTASEQWLVVLDGLHGAAIRAVWATGPPTEARFEWCDLIPGGPPELLLDARTVVERGTWRRLVLCASAPLRCIRIPLVYEYRDVAARVHEGYRIDADFAPTSITLRPTWGSAPLPTLLGTHTYAEVLANDSLLWPNTR